MGFNGFSKQTLDFFENLKNNNTKQWFERNRLVFNRHVIGESELFVLAMGDRLRKFAPEITAIPKTDKSIFRIYRDVRFSKEKHPYKTHLALLFWEGSRKKTDKDDQRGFNVKGIVTNPMDYNFPEIEECL